MIASFKLCPSIFCFFRFFSLNLDLNFFNPHKIKPKAMNRQQYGSKYSGSRKKQRTEMTEVFSNSPNNIP